MIAKNWSRRQLLRGAGVALALPWLETFAPRTARGPGRRRQAPLHRRCTSRTAPPTSGGRRGAGASWKLSPILEPLTPVKSYVHRAHQRPNYSPFGGHVEPSHGPTAPRRWTGVKATGASNDNNAISVDQVIADHGRRERRNATTLHSLQVGLSTLDSFARRPARAALAQHLVEVGDRAALQDGQPAGGVRSAGRRRPPLNNIDQMPDAGGRAAAALKKSALDYVLEDADGPADAVRARATSSASTSS